MSKDRSGEEREEVDIGGAAGLTFDPAKDQDNESYAKEIRDAIQTTELELVGSNFLPTEGNISWDRAKTIVESFQPVPWFIWRLSNFVFGAHGRPNKVSEGLVLGLRRLLFAAASDGILGKGEKVNNTREALKVLRSDVIAAISVIHGVSRKLHSKRFERAWQPILDDAIIRAHVGFFVGQMNLDFGPGRGMLAGFAGRVGLAILISTGSEFQAEESLKSLTLGSTLRDVGIRTYGVDPLQVSALTLSASGCGRDSAFGTLGYAALEDKEQRAGTTREQMRWLAAFTITEAARTKAISSVPQEMWEVLGYYEQQDIDDLTALVNTLIRHGHGWNWLK